MKGLGFGRYALTSCVAAAMLAGCGALQPPIGAPGAMTQSPAIATHAERGGSWMQPDASKHDLLYVTNNYDVTVYSYPRGRLVGTLKHHFFRPLTECSDKAGNVYVTDGDNVFIYAHGGTKPFRTLTYSGALTVGCSSDPTTGNLAVTYEFGFSRAYVAVYKNASGSPALYQSGNLIFDYCSYDASGNLYVDGDYGSGEDFGFVELPKGGSALKLITLNQSFQNPGIVQWDGKYMTVGDNTAENIYRFRFSGSQGTLVGTTSLAGAPEMYQWWIEGDKVVGGNGNSPPAVYYWGYPAGGSPIKTITKGMLYPDGVTVSKGLK